MKRLGWLLILLVVGSLLLPLNVATQSSTDVLAYGTKVVLDNGVETVCIGKTADGKYIWQATIGSPKYLNDLRTPIEARWEYNLEKEEWNTCANLFTSTAKGSKITVWYEGKKLSWQPDVFVGTKKQPVSTEQLIINDPINENYFGNTLQWQYGDITRNVRIIEGMLQEYYIIDEIPRDDVLIISHSEKDAGFIWTRPATAWSINTTTWTINFTEVDLVVDGDDVILTMETMQNTTFPIIIDPDTTFTTSDKDGVVGYNDEDKYQDWNPTHDASAGTGVGDSSVSYNNAMSAVYQSGTEPNRRFKIVRSFFYFNTVSLPDDANITAAVFRLYGDEGCDGVSVQKGTQGSTLDKYDYNNFAGNEYGHKDDWSGSSYNEITFNAQGRSDISLTGITKLCAREYYGDYLDDADYTQGGMNDCGGGCCYYEKGAGYRPELIVTYGASASPAITTNNATYVTLTTAQLNSYLDDDGGEACDVRFQYSTTSGGGGGYENFSNYTEVDPNGHILPDGVHIDFKSYSNESAYLYDDKGVDYFTNFTHRVAITPQSLGGTTGIAVVWMLANAIGDEATLKGASETLVLLRSQASSTYRRFYLGEGYSGNEYWVFYEGFNFTTPYYFTLTKSGVSLYCYIYSDAAQTTSVATLNLTLHGDWNFGYVYGSATDNIPTNDNLDVDIDNLTLSDVWTSTPWVNDTYVTGNTPYVNIEGLAVNTTYYFRVQARNPEGTTNGNELSFTTSAESDDPTNLVAYPSCHSVSLAWIKGGNTTNTMLRYQVGTYPATNTSGVQVYFGSMSTATHTGLSPGTNYYYRAWGESSGNYTANYTEVMTTTPACGAAGDTPDAPDMPTGWFGAPDCTNLENLPFYNIVNDMADEFGMPHTNFWLLIFLFAATLIGLFVYHISHTATAAIIAVGVVLVILLHSLGGLLWIMFAVGIIATGIFMAVRQP